MNWLAHILLSRNHIDHQLGNVLADPCKGRAWASASIQLREGMAMHKALDRFTDKHPVVKQSQTRLRDKGYLRGVVVDVLYDHFLSNHWSHFVRMPLTKYVDQFEQQAGVAIGDFPDRPRAFVLRLIDTGWLAQYGNFDDMVTTLKRIDGRLSDRIKAKETNSSYVQQIKANYAALERDFLLFFPDLVGYFRQHQHGGDNPHLL